MFRSKEGKALIIVIIIMALLAILTPALVVASNTEVSHTTKYGNGMQAYLYARSGVDSALDWLVVDGKLRESFTDSASYDGFAYMSGSLGTMTVYFTAQSDSEDISVTIEDTGAGLRLTSVGVYKNSTKTIELMVYLTAVGGTEVTMPVIDKALFLVGQGTSADPSLVMTGDPEIEGDLGANTTGTDSLVFGGYAQYIVGDVYLHAIDSDDVIASGADPQTGIIYEGQPELIYPPATFPVFETYPPYDDYNVDLTGNNPFTRVSLAGKKEYTLDLDGDYEFGAIEISGGRILNIDLGGEDRSIVCDTFDIGGGYVNLINRGSLTVYVRNTLTIDGNSTINSGAEGGDIFHLVFFYAGTEKLHFNGNTAIVASLITDTADYKANGTSGIQGHLIIGGDSIEFSGTTDLNTRIVYSPDAHVVFTGTSLMHGAVVAKTATLGGTTNLIYDGSDISGLPGDILPGVGEVIPDLTTGATYILDDYYWQ